MIDVIARAAESPITVWEVVPSLPLFDGDAIYQRHYRMLDEDLVDLASFAPIQLAQQGEALFYSALTLTERDAIRVKHEHIRYVRELLEITIYKNVALVNLIVGDGDKEYPLWYVLVLEDSFFRIVSVTTEEPKQTIKVMFHSWCKMYLQKS